MEEPKFQMDFAGRPLVIEVGKLAKQASGAALVRYGDTAVFVTATGSKEAREDADFFPLTVDYEEKMYSVGKIPGGFIKREANRLNRQPFLPASSTVRSARSSRRHTVMTSTSWLMISA